MRFANSAEEYVIKSAGGQCLKHFTRKCFDTLNENEIKVALENVHSWAIYLQYLDLRKPFLYSDDMSEMGLEFERVTIFFRTLEQFLDQVAIKSRESVLMAVRYLCTSTVNMLYDSLISIKNQLSSSRSQFETYERLDQVYGYFSKSKSIVFYTILVATATAAYAKYDWLRHNDEFIHLMKLISTDVLKSFFAAVNVDILITQNCQHEFKLLVLAVDQHNTFQWLFERVLSSLYGDQEAAILQLRTINQIANKRLAQISFIVEIKQLYRSIGATVLRPTDYFQSNLLYHLPDFITAFIILKDLPPLKYSLLPLYSDKWENIFNSFMLEMARINVDWKRSLMRLLIKDASIEEVAELNELLSIALPFKINDDVFSVENLTDISNLKILMENIDKAVSVLNSDKIRQPGILVINKLKNIQIEVQRYVYQYDFSA
ncbi:hypothetical protein ACOME3_002082 [Neoechinorhynchus agilis]